MNASSDVKKPYLKNFLKQVIVRADFARELPLTSEGPSTQFIQSLRDFPVSGLEVTTHKVIEVSRDKQPKETTSIKDQWSYRNEKSLKTATLTKEHFAIEYKNHDSYENLRKEFLKPFRRLRKDFGDVIIKRLGLRYVNEITLDSPNPIDWHEYLKPELISNFDLADDRNTISRTFSVLEFAYEDQTRLRFQYGMPNPDYPSVIKRKQFVLDYDGFSETMVECDELEKFLNVFHKRINEAFEQVILPPLRKLMGQPE